jgi:hypothetical protein
MVASRGTIQVIITIAVFVWAVMLILQGVRLEFGFLRPYSVAVGGMTEIRVKSGH